VPHVFVVFYSGKGGPDKLDYELTMDFYADIDASVSIYVNVDYCRI